MATSTEVPTDGRVQRSERSREAIVQALLDLIGDGTLEPTAQQVAERANVGVRTVFRHFSDMETLFTTMNDQLTEKVNALFVEQSQTGPLESRIAELIERRAAIFGLIGPYKRASAIQRWRSAFLQKQHELSIKILRRDLQRWLPEIAELDGETMEALELNLSFESWDRLRSDQRLGSKRANDVLRRVVSALLTDLVSRFGSRRSSRN